MFQWAPTLGGECYELGRLLYPENTVRFNGHPPLGVNATHTLRTDGTPRNDGFNGHPPLGVNATYNAEPEDLLRERVSMGTHPWG